MSNRKYKTFVRSSSPSQENAQRLRLPFLSGEHVKKIYLEEVKEVEEPFSEKTECPNTYNNEISASVHNYKYRNKIKSVNNVTDKDLYLMVQNNEVEKLKYFFDVHPEKLNQIDEFGWSLLMIACQANAVETASELVKRGINMSIRDKAGNSAHSLVIKNKNLALIDILLSVKSKAVDQPLCKVFNRKTSDQYTCAICNGKVFSNKDVHLSSTVHNINASKGRKITASYKIPQSNRGYQMMIKFGWDKDSGLGPDGSGKLYPIKPKEKKDRQGLGHQNKREKPKDVEPTRHNRRSLREQHNLNKRLEIDFRRQFY